MREIINQIIPWYQAGEPFTIATVTRTWSSSPRPVGAAMAVSQSGEVIGSVSGGCVEGALYEASMEVLKTKTPQSVTYGVSDDSAFAVGLTCGGTLEIFIYLVTKETFPNFEEVANQIIADKPICVATIISGAEKNLGERIVFTPSSLTGSFSSEGLTHSVSEDGKGLLEQGTTRVVKFGSNGERRMDQVAVFVEAFAPAPQMLVFGAIDFAAAVARIGKFLGYQVTVCDARPLFATEKRFPEADKVVVSWPHKYLKEIEVDERTAICVLTHDPKFDVPLLELALKTKAGYIGAMGSRRTHNDRLEKLKLAGVSEAELSRLRSPIGLDLGARTPEETAVSIAAEIISDLWGGTKQSLSVGDAPIHKVSMASETSEPPKVG
jgi:xanthine dehydrogenase accessory factor